MSCWARARVRRCNLFCGLITHHQTQDHPRQWSADTKPADEVRFKYVSYCAKCTEREGGWVKSALTSESEKCSLVLLQLSLPYLYGECKLFGAGAIGSVFVQQWPWLWQPRIAETQVSVIGIFWVGETPRISPDKQILKQNLSIATFWFGESIFWQKFPGWNFSPQTLWPLCGMQKHDRGRTQGSPHISDDYLSSQAMPHSLLGYLLSPFTNTYFFWNLDFFFFNGRQDALSKSVKISWQKKNIFPGQTW